MRTGRPKVPEEVRFWSKVNKQGAIQSHCVHLGECWEWMAFRKPEGYGKCDGMTEARAHRMSWFLTHGPIPDGMQVRHKCDNPCCVRPDHLELGTIKDNMRDRDSRGRLVVLKGMAWPMVKLDDETVLLIRKLSKEGLPATKIQAQISVRISISQIKRIVRGESWKHLLPPAIAA